MTKWTAPDIASIRGDNSRPLQKIFGSLTEYLKEYQNTLESESAESSQTFVRNGEATTLTIGTVVYLDAQQGNRATVKRAINTSDATSAKTLGVVAELIPAHGDGLVTTLGYLEKVNTSAFTAGDTLYLGATAGTMTTTKPYAPNHLVYVGVVVRANAGNGIIYVRCQNGYELNEIHDVQITSPATGNILMRNGSNLWINTPQTSITSVGTITTGTWSGSFGAVSGANLTSLNATNLSSGTVAPPRISGSYTGITGVGTLSSGSIPATLLTDTIASARISGSYTGITGVGTLSAGSIPVSLLTGTTLPSSIVTSSLTSVGTLTSLTTTGQVTMTRGALGTTAGNEIVFLDPNATTTNGDRLDTRLIRNGNGSDWTTAIWRMGRKVDSTRMGFIQFGDGAGAQDVRFGVGTTTYGIITNGGLSVSSNIFVSASGSNFAAQNPTTGTGNAAQWVSVLGIYVLYRNTSTRDDKENFQPLNGIVTPSMIDNIDISLWNRKGATGFPEIGPMAEDMDEVSPFLSIRGMDCDEEGNIVPTAPSGINQNSWLSLLTLGIQDLRKRVEELETA
jgi:hypothetical protein